jgi:ketosteroid isomerase-like protein
MRGRAWVALALLAALTLRAALPLRAQDADPASVLIAIDATFSWTTQQLGRAKAFEMYLAPDAVALFEGGSPIEGRQAIVERLRARETGARLSWTPAKASVAQSGDFGVTWGLYELTDTGADGQTRTTRGSYMTVWRKQGEGPWKVVLGGANGDPAP